MKILALTDVHGVYDIAEEIVRKESPDVLIICGDLTTVGTMREAEEAIVCFRSYVDRVFCISGNMDLPQHDELFERLGVSLNGRGVIHGSIGFFGVSAAPHSPLHTPYEISEEEIARRMTSGYKQIAESTIKVLVSHAPPFGTKTDITHSGIHVGSMAVRDFIEEIQPDVIVCGHIHEAWGQDVIEKSRIINCGQASRGNYGVIEISESGIDLKNFRLPGSY